MQIKEIKKYIYKTYKSPFEKTEKNATRTISA